MAPNSAKFRNLAVLCPAWIASSFRSWLIANTCTLRTIRICLCRRMCHCRSLSTLAIRRGRFFFCCHVVLAGLDAVAGDVSKRAKAMNETTHTTVGFGTKRWRENKPLKAASEHGDVPIHSNIFATRHRVLAFACGFTSANRKESPASKCSRVPSFNSNSV
ncbi:hypothetical protein L596_004970 [Steinernema carpocapsae]|uniref:Uncharacterized protein n=1 Tax=Steinernema carpocapsae TaxID=34508 RepID=A0A4U8UYJ9_STECR|nr:hypothetical protein L596_004970 [Steinernema carpocapsae]